MVEPIIHETLVGKEGKCYEYVTPFLANELPQEHARRLSPWFRQLARLAAGEAREFLSRAWFIDSEAAELGAVVRFRNSLLQQSLSSLVFCDEDVWLNLKSDNGKMRAGVREPRKNSSAEREQLKLFPSNRSLEIFFSYFSGLNENITSCSGGGTALSLELVDPEASAKPGNWLGGIILCGNNNAQHTCLSLSGAVGVWTMEKGIYSDDSVECGFTQIANSFEGFLDLYREFLIEDMHPNIFKNFMVSP